MPETNHIEQLEDLASDNNSTLIQIPYRWEPRLYQDDAWQARRNHILRECLCWHRRAGKDLFSINEIGVSNMERPGLYWHCFPTQLQGRKTIWDGVTDDGRPFLDHFPGFKKPGAKESLVESVRQDLMQIKFKATRDPLTHEMRETGGTYQIIGLDDPDSTVGPNPFGIVYSEWSICPERAWHLHKPMLNANGGWAIFIFTMRGRNHAYKMMQKHKTNPKWFVQLLTVEDTYKLVETTEVDEETKQKVFVPRPVVSQEQIQEDRDDGMPEETVQSEYYGSADAPMPGSYYGAIIDKMEKGSIGDDGLPIEGTIRITNVPFDNHGLVYTMWDIGHDSTDIIFFQAVAKEVHLIDHYSNQGEGFPHYVAIMDKKARELGYCYETHYGPHDLAQREYMGGDGKNKLEQARKLGIKFRLVPKHSIEDGIETTRSFLMRCWIDKGRCEKLIDGIRSYRKEFDEKHQVFKENPVHDWASHKADALRCGAMGFNEVTLFRKKKMGEMNRSITNYNEFAH